MSDWAAAVLEASFESVMTDRVRVVPLEGAAFECKVYLLEEEARLDMGGLASAPPVGVQTLEVPKSFWATPQPGDLVEVLDADDIVTRRLEVTSAPLSLDGKRLTWTVNCLEQDL